VYISELIPGSERDIDADLVSDGWTEKDFDPDMLVFDEGSPIPP
jgi:hypothetical protein